MPGLYLKKVSLAREIFKSVGIDAPRKKVYSVHQMNGFIKSINSGPIKIICSGTFITFDRQPVTITFASNLQLTLEFVEDKENSDKIYGKTETLGENKLKLTLFNMLSPLGGGSLAPVEIGEYENKKLLFSIRQFTLENSEQITVHYTFYQHE